MAGTITITAPTGPGSSVTSLVLTDIRSVTFDPIASRLSVMLSDGTIKNFDIKATTTITATASAGTFTFTVSQ